MTEDNDEEVIATEIPHTFRNLGRALSLLRDLGNMTLRETAKKAGVGPSQLSKYENGHTLPRLDSLEKILSVHGMTLLDFFNTMALLDLLEEEARSGNRRESKVFNLLHTRGVIGNAASLALRRVVDDLMILHTEIMTAAILPGIEKRGNE